MTDFNVSDSHQLEIRDDTRTVLGALAVVRYGSDVTDDQRLELLHELVEAGRANLNPKPKATPAAGAVGRGRRARQEGQS